MFSPHGKSLMPAFPERNNAVFLSCDGKYLPHAMTTVASILATGAKGNRYDILMLVHEVESDDLTAALEWARGFRNCRLRFINAGECLDLAAMKEFHITDTFPLVVYFRLFAPMIFQNYDTIAYLDSDIVALADVAELCRHSLGNALIGACHDFGFECKLRMPHTDPGKRFFENAARCGIEYRPGDPYFNSGVMVMNLKAMREEKTEERFLNAIRLAKKPMLPDQDILNLVCKGRVDFIDTLWNCMEWVAGLGWDLPKTLHFAEKKPWDFRYSGGNGSYYWAYSKMSPSLLHQRVADALLRQSTLSANAASFLRLAFHLSRCCLIMPFASAARRKNFALRRRGYCADMRMLLRHWRNKATIRFPPRLRLPHAIPEASADAVLIV